MSGRGGRFTGSVLGAMLLMAGAGAAAAQTTLPAATQVPPGSPASGFAPTAYAEPTEEFTRNVRELDATQVQLADAAVTRASPPVQAFARTVKQTVSGGAAGMKGMSNDQGVPLVGTVKLNREHQTLVDQLRAPNANVDRLFVDYEILVLEEDQGLVESYATGGTDARFREAAALAASSDKVMISTARALQH